MDVPPRSAREDVERAENAFGQARLLGGWGLLYLAAAGAGALHTQASVQDRLSWLAPSPWDVRLLAVLAAVGVLAGLTGYLRGRAAIAALAGLAESCYDLYGLDLAEALGLIGSESGSTPQLVDSGAAVTERSHKLSVEAVPQYGDPEPNAHGSSPYEAWETETENTEHKN
ncbi:hypothetical protein BJF83_20525 [Nocardiopsis sp. CNR-923]|uniref:hypothetical protein n=1 Tax=Nocardiopsis sp. CNR-923 TaxID=1904965 RepID=UPI00095C69B4|nr:hypothetical protein [Nocardiopsis sp. CNR-923]OLT26614.1 hypothetical protein BJF83_20525 [Nocardiopsis sp. CNR-923]